MKILEKLTKKVVGNTSEAVVTTVKKQTGNIVKDVAPAVVGLLGLVGLGIIFRKSSGSAPVHAAQKSLPMVTNTTTNNYFFDSSAATEVIEKIIKGA